MIKVGSKVDLIANTFIEGVSVNKKNPMRGIIIQRRFKKIGKNCVKMCLFCSDIQKDKNSGYEFSERNFIEIKD